MTTLAAVAYVSMALTGAGGPAAVVLGGGLALSSTAVAMQVLQDRNETGSRHGRAAFAVLLLQASAHSTSRSLNYHPFYLSLKIDGYAKGKMPILLPLKRLCSSMYHKGLCA